MPCAHLRHHLIATHHAIRHTRRRRLRSVHAVCAAVHNHWRRPAKRSRSDLSLVWPTIRRMVADGVGLDSSPERPLLSPSLHAQRLSRCGASPRWHWFAISRSVCCAGKFPTIGPLRVFSAIGWGAGFSARRSSRATRRKRDPARRATDCATRRLRDSVRLKVISDVNASAGR